MYNPFGQSTMYTSYFSLPVNLFALLVFSVCVSVRRVGANEVYKEITG